MLHIREEFARRNCNQHMQTRILIAVFCLVQGLHEATGTGGTVKLKELPVKTNYAASDSSYDDAGMGPLFDFARSFINSALPGGFPQKFMNETTKKLQHGNFGMDDIKELLNRFKGYVAAIAVGVLFIVIFPIVGTCFCCCRLCGNCGGNNKQEVSDKIHMKRRIYMCVLFVFTTFTLVGNICTYVSNGRMSVALTKIGDTVDSNLDDLDSYLALVEQQVETIGVDNLQATKSGILYYLDQNIMEKEISQFVLDGLSGGALTEMQTHIQDTKKAFDDIINSKATIDGMLLPSLNPLAGPEFTLLTTKKAVFDTFSSSDLVGQVQNQVITQIHSSLSGINAQKLTVDNAFRDIEPKVANVVQQIKDLRRNAKNGINLQDYKQKTRSYTSTMKDFDKYRYAAAAGLASITTLVVTLQYLGLAFGTLGQGWATEPSNRGCVSTAGGNLLMASVGFIFLFSSMLMLLTTICFSIGSILERFVCQPLSSSDLELVQVMNPYIPTKDSLNADLSDILKDCRADKSAYVAFHLEPKVHLTTLDATLDAQKQRMDHAFNTVLSGVGSISSVSFAGSLTNLNDFQTSLDGLHFQTIQTTLQTALGSVSQIPQPPAYRQALQTMLTASQVLQREQAAVGGISARFRTSLTQASTRISADMGNLVGKFKGKITGIIDQYVNSTKRDIKENMGRCSPVWNLYESILVTSFCKYTVDAFNGFWFSIGWCIFFFVPSLIFSVKLAKHFRRANGAPAGNQVGHMDEIPITGY